MIGLGVMLVLMLVFFCMPSDEKVDRKRLPGKWRFHFESLEWRYWMGSETNVDRDAPLWCQTLVMSGGHGYAMRQGMHPRWKTVLKIVVPLWMLEVIFWAWLIS